MRIGLGAIADPLPLQAVIEDLGDLGMFLVIVIAFLKLLAGDIVQPEHLLV
jgi:hypothetical protein